MIYFIASLLFGLFAFAIGWFTRKYADEQNLLYSFTEDDLENTYRTLWEKGRVIGRNKSITIPTPEYLELQFSIDKHESIKEHQIKT